MIEHQSSRAHPYPETLSLRRVGIDTHQEHVAYMRADCPVCRSEGFTAQSRIEVRSGTRSVLATLNVVHGDWLAHGEVGLSESAWRLLAPRERELVSLAHPRSVDSLGAVRAKIYGHTLGAVELQEIIRDIVAGRYADVHLAAFITACAGNHFSIDETVELTRAMVAAGQCLSWPQRPILDKHSVGGLPGNRTTPIVVAIVAANGLCMPKTSSRAITSPAGTADTMETLAPVNLTLDEMRSVVERENGCVVWGGAAELSPADDVLIRVERALDIDSEGQLVASVLSKKLAAGSTHVVLDVPVGLTAKVRSVQAADALIALISVVAQRLDLVVRPSISDGSQPIGRGIGPALEARDVIAVLRRELGFPSDLRERACLLAGDLLEIGGKAVSGEGARLAGRTIDEGRAWSKFQAICEAQGGMRKPPVASHTHTVVSLKPGLLTGMDNRRLARIAKLAGAPSSGAAGVLMHVRAGQTVEREQPMYTIHAQTPGEMAYALEFARQNDVFAIAEEEV